jgi:hypothetical protein
MARPQGARCAGKQGRSATLPTIRLVPLQRDGPTKTGEIPRKTSRFFEELRSAMVQADGHRDKTIPCGRAIVLTKTIVIAGESGRAAAVQDAGAFARRLVVGEVPDWQELLRRRVIFKKCENAKQSQIEKEGIA